MKNTFYFYLHGENLIPSLVFVYALAIAGWTAICYVAIKAWLNRKKKK